jgi:hypothetical protein
LTYNLRAVLAAASIGAIAAATSAQAAPHGVKVGLLTCHVESGWGYVIGSSRDVRCDFQPSEGERDRYTGSISKLGVDIGYTSSADIVWEVVAPSSDVRAGALQGDYAGATASATVGVGVGAHVLLGGFDKSIALQPVSVEGNTGLDVAAGIGELSLHRAEAAPAAYEEHESRREEMAEAGPPPREDEAPPPRPMHHVVHHHHHRQVCRPE